ncbi:probable mitochondrial adenine nucleotide transporter BTL3 [Zingiber officinale]|uniref:probable mitochondrial adenine nucleotide transporter BTL3 n=1 Tax=Zingiber officinale TaxID=94328 RepID=UPI001C4CDD6E|nr:probable mitochondrial adenine nucleotide transporter BTL3 [Zingiber officinale]
MPEMEFRFRTVTLSGIRTPDEASDHHPPLFAAGVHLFLDLRWDHESPDINPTPRRKLAPLAAILPGIQASDNPFTLFAVGRHLSQYPRCKPESPISTPPHRLNPAPFAAIGWVSAATRWNPLTSISLSVKGGDDLESVASSVTEGQQISDIQNRNKKQDTNRRVQRAKATAMNTTKHLWSGAVAAMVSRTFVAPLERLKLEYILRGEQSHLFALVHKIATTQGLKGFWKGNLANILRTAPFKAVHFCAYDTYRKQLLQLSGKQEITNFERFIAGAAAGITATVLCIPMDTIRTKMVAPGGEALGGIVGAFRYMVRTEGFFSLYKGLVPSLVSMAPSGAVFYGVYDMLKAAYLSSPEGKKRVTLMRQQEGKQVNALDQLELGPLRTLLYGAVAGCCAEAATYPFEVVRRQLQMQVRANKMSAAATLVKIVEQGGLPALYAGVVPSLLQVLPSASISYLVYEVMKIVLKVQ